MGREPEQDGHVLQVSSSSKAGSWPPLSTPAPQLRIPFTGSQNLRGQPSSGRSLGTSCSAHPPSPLWGSAGGAPSPGVPEETVPCILRRWKRGEPRKLLRMELRRLLQAAPPTPPPGLGGGVVPGVPVGLARGVCRGECKGVPPEERGEPGGPGRGVERALGGGGCSPAPPPLGPREGSVCVLEVGEPPPRASSPAPGSGEKEKTGLCGGAGR